MRFFIARNCNVPATPEEMKALVDAFEAAHSPIARALADLLVRGKAILDEHRTLPAPLGDEFETLVLKLSAEHGISRQTLQSASAALERVRFTDEQLDQLP